MMKNIKFFYLLIFMTITNAYSNQNELIQQFYYKGQIIGYGVATAVTIKSELALQKNIHILSQSICKDRLTKIGLITTNKDLNLATNYCNAILSVKDDWE